MSTINSISNGLLTTVDNTGTYAIQTNSNNAVYIDGSQKVGIGTTAPGYQLHVSGTTMVANGDLIMNRIDGYDASFVLPSTMTTNNKGLFFQQAGGGNLYKIQMNANWVLKPSQPFFHAHGLNTITPSGTVCVYPTTDSNVGSYYNTSTGKFTAPVSGNYIFGWTGIGNSTNDVYRWRFQVNGSNVRDIHLRQDTTATGGEYATNGMFTIPWTLSAGDYVNIYTASDGGSSFYSSGSSADDYPRFWGYLLG
jgi:hypothetical protein